MTVHRDREMIEQPDLSEEDRPRSPPLADEPDLRLPLEVAVNRSSRRMEAKGHFLESYCDGVAPDSNRNLPYGVIRVHADGSGRPGCEEGVFGARVDESPDR